MRSKKGGPWCEQTEPLSENAGPASGHVVWKEALVRAFSLSLLFGDEGPEEFSYCYQDKTTVIWAQQFCFLVVLQTHSYNM